MKMTNIHDVKVRNCFRLQDAFYSLSKNALKQREEVVLEFCKMRSIKGE